MKATTENNTTLIDELLAEQRTLTAVERFSQHHDRSGHATKEKIYSADARAFAKSRRAIRVSSGPGFLLRLQGVRGGLSFAEWPR